MGLTTAQRDCAACDGDDNAKHSNRHNFISVQDIETIFAYMVVCTVREFKLFGVREFSYAI